MTAGVATAGEFQHRNLLVGDRAAGLGGAYTALSNDPSGLFYNPAGVVHAEQHSSTSINALAVSSTEYRGILPGGVNLDRSSTVVVPGFFGAMTDLGAGKGGFFLAVPDYVGERQSTPFSLASFSGLTADSGGTFANDVDSRTYLLGLAIGQPIAAGWSWGGSLALVLRDQREIRRLDAVARGLSGDRLSTLTAIRVSDESRNLRPQLALHYRDPAGLSLGLTVDREFGLSRTYEYDYRLVVSQQDAAGTVIGGGDEQVVVRNDDSQRYPWHIVAGAALALSPEVLVTLNVDHYTRVGEGDVVDPRAPPVTRPYAATTNVAAGLEVELREGYRMRGSVFTDRANVRLEGAQTFERREQVNLVGASLSLSARVGERRYEAGFYGAFGDGESVLGDLAQANFSSTDRVRTRKQHFVLFFGLEL